ncbi:MAG: 23S rRNA (uracil(1939)-C(5))-methyltransferase RlmD, partial [Erysipelotrichia bacterium]|nr:23S rRNA (uracil(1939)-C(5))-methyltransferase RlmD [Erysipelotrichia bacterium]
MEKNQTFTGTAEGYTYDGEGVVKTGGLVFFVPGLLAGEEAELSVTAMKKSYGYARIVRIIKPSVHRAEPQCSAYRLCGGCSLLHMDHEEQMQFKQDKVKGCFRQNADMDLDIMPVMYASVQEHYRDKVQVPVQVNNGQVEMGFYQNHTNRIIPYDSCLVQTDLSNQIISSMKLWMQQLGCANVFRHVLIKHAENTDQAMVCMIVRQYPFQGSEKLVNLLKDTYPRIRSILAVVNRRSDNVILDGKEELLYGNPFIEETLLGCTFRISVRSFYQINPFATEILYSKALEKAQLSGRETVIDLYCGTGTIGIL